MLKNLILLFIGAMIFGSSVYAKDGGRKIASVDLQSDNAIKSKAIELGKSYVAPGKKGTKWSVRSLTKDPAKTVVELLYILPDVKGEPGGECYMSVTFEPPSETDSKRGSGSALIESGLCFI